MTHLQEQRLLHRLANANQVPYVNNGGCAVVAYAAVDYINSLPNCKAQVVYLMHTQRDKYDIIALRGGLSRSCCHAVVEVNGSYYDSEGHRTKSALKEDFGPTVAIPISMDMAERSINGRGWNPLFERERGVPAIAKAFSMTLEHIA